MCSGHFHGGEKREGDIPVADPAVDPPLSVELPPPPPKRSEKRSAHNTSIGKRQRLENNIHIHHNGNGFSNDSFSSGKTIPCGSPNTGSNGLSSQNNGLTINSLSNSLGSNQLANGNSLSSNHIPSRFSASPTASKIFHIYIF